MRGQKNALTNAFGTKVARKTAQSMAENAQLSNAPAGAANAAESAILSSMPASSPSGAGGDISSKRAAMQAEVQAAKPLPRANTAASHPADVYAIESLVPGGHETLRVLPGVSEWQGAVESGSGVQGSSRFVVKRVEAVAKSGNTTQLQLLRYILLLLELVRSLRPAKGKSSGPGTKLVPREELQYILSSTTGTKLDASTPAENLIPEHTVEAIRRRFSPQGNSRMSKTEVTLLHTTICALSLHIPPQPGKDATGGNGLNELATDFSDLRDDLRLDNDTITHYFRELGCRVDKPRDSEFAKWGIKGGKAEAAARRVARLRVPVEFPKIGRGARR